MRTYSEREIAAIIERAAERQAEADQREGAPGLTLDEIEKLGTEAGIDPAHLRAAAQEVGTRGATTTGEAGMTRTHVHVERWVDGPLTDAAWEDTVAHLRQHFGAEMSAMMGMSQGGEVQQVGQSFEWSHTSGLGVQTRVSVSPRGDRTRLRITQLVGLSSTRNEGIGYGSLIGGIAAIIASVIGLVNTMSGLVTVAVLALTFAVVTAISVPVVTRLDERWRAKKLRQLGELADDVAPILAASPDALEATATRADQPLGAEPRLDLDALDEAPETRNAASTRARTR